MSTKITECEYSGFQRAYDHFNAHLFKSTLPQCLITLQRHPNAKGYYHAEHFKGRKNDSKTDEIALNPDTFGGRSDEQILSTLVHEMCHLWEFHFAKRKSRAGYHNKEWGKKMVEVGLQPICFDTHINGVEKLSGQKMTHRIIENGMFEQVTTRLIASGFQLNWQSGVMPQMPFSGWSFGNGDDDDLSPLVPMKWDKSKLKFTCLGCNQKAWAKYTAALVCGDCQKILFPDVPLEKEVITPETEIQLLAFLQGLETWKPLDFYGSNLTNRAVISYGIEYVHSQKMNLPDAPPLPRELLKIRNLCARKAGFDRSETFTQTLITRYPVGAGIGKHRDADRLGENVLILALGADATMVFHSQDTQEREIFFPRRSLLVIAGSLRRKFKHELKPVNQERYSVTFRDPASLNVSTTH